MSHIFTFDYLKIKLFFLLFTILFSISPVYCVYHDLKVINNLHPFTGDLDNWNVDEFWIRNASIVNEEFYNIPSAFVYFNVSLPEELRNVSGVNEYDINVTFYAYCPIGGGYATTYIFCKRGDEVRYYQNDISFKLENFCYYKLGGSWKSLSSFEGVWIRDYDATIFLHNLTVANERVGRSIYKDDLLSAWSTGISFPDRGVWRYILRVSNDTHVLAPNLSIDILHTNGEINYSSYADVWSNGSRSYPFLYREDVINVSYNFTNVQDVEHHGMALDVVANISWDADYVQSLSNPLSEFYSKNIGNVLTGEKNNIYELFRINGEEGESVKSYFNFNISDRSGMYNDSLYFTYFIISPHLSIFPNSNALVRYGENVKRIIVIHNNASEVENIGINVTSFKVSNGVRIKKVEYFNLSSPVVSFLNTSVDLNEGETWAYYLFNYSAIDSGEHVVDVNVTLRDYNRPLYTSFSFNVSFGRLKVNITFPFYRILFNQSGNLTVKYTAERGDLWYVNFSFTSFDEDVLHIREKEKNISLFISNGSTVTIKIPISTLNIGYTGIIFNYTMYNFTFPLSLSAGYHIYKVDVPKIVAPSTINITDSQHIFVYIVGNLSEIMSDLSYISINKTLFSEIDEYPLPPPSLNEEYKCFEEEDGQTSKNIKNGSNVIENKDVIYPMSMLDDSLSTYTTFKSYSHNNSYVIIDFGKEYLLSNLSILGFGSDNNTERLYLYANSSGSWKKVKGFEEGIEIPENTPTYINISLIESSLRTRYLMINITGEGISVINNIDIWTVAVFSHDPCYNFSLEYDKINRSGKYNITSFIHLASGNSSTSHKNMFVNFGTLQINFCNATLLDNTFFSGETKNLTYIYLLPLNGDVVNVTTLLNISSPDILNISTSESYEKHTSYISYVEYGEKENMPVNIGESVCQGYLLPYNLTANVVAEMKIVHINVSSTYSLNGSSVVSSYAYYGNITVRPKDKQPPHAYWMNITFPKGDVSNYSSYVMYNTSNVYQPLYVSFSAEDNVVVNKYSFEFYDPDGKRVVVPNKTLYPANVIEGSLSKGVFWTTVSGEYFPKIGNYTNFTLTVYDISGNSSTTVSYLNITVYNTSHIRWGRKADIYNRGQYFSIDTYSYDNERRLKGGAYNLTLYKKNESTGEYEFLNFYSCNYSANIFLCNSSFLDTSSKDHDILFNITPSYPIGDYSLVVYSNTSGNIGERVINFSVSDKLRGIIDYAVSSDGKYVSMIFIHLYYQNTLDSIEDTFIPLSNASVKCSTLPDYWALENGGEPSYYVPAGYITLPSSQKCPVPTTLYLNVSNYYNNTLYVSRDVASSHSTSSYSSGGGGGGRGAVARREVVYVNNTNITTSKIERFDVSLTPSTLTLLQHQSGEIYIGYENTGNIPITLYLSVQTDCRACIINLSKNKVMADVGEGSSLLSTIYVPLFQPSGDYKIKYTFRTSEGVSKEKIVLLHIKSDRLIKRLKVLGYKIDAMEERIKAYALSGVSVNEERDILRELKRIYNITLYGVKEDNYSLLLNNIDRLDSLVANVELELERKKWIKILKDNLNILILLSLSIIVALLTFFFYWLPLIFININIARQKRRIRISEQTRISTEKQYFARKIDEATFRSIMSREEDNILKAKQELSVLLAKRYYLVTLNIRGLRELKKELELKQKQQRYVGYSRTSSLPPSKLQGKKSMIRRIVSKLKLFRR